MFTCLVGIFMVPKYSTCKNPHYYLIVQFQVRMRQSYHDYDNIL